MELVVYVTLRKCSRACEYFSPRYAYVLLKYGRKNWYLYITLRNVLLDACAYLACCLQLVCIWMAAKLELVVYVTLRKCSRACEYRYAYEGGKLVLSP